MKKDISNSFTITEEKFKNLYNKYYSRLCRFVYYYVNSKSSAEEIVQDVFAGLWDKKQKLQIRTNIESYLYIAVKNEAFSKIKNEKKVNNLELIKHIDDNLAHDFDEESFRKRLEFALKTLPEKCRIIYSLKYIEGLTTSEIACYLELSEKTIETQIYRALIKLRKQLAPFITEFYTQS